MFVVIEGIDGSGKSTLVKSLYDMLQRYFAVVHKTKEPNFELSSGEELKQILLGNLELKSQYDMACLFAENRREHIKLLKQWNTNDIVVCDRYLLSSLVYQYSDMLGFEDIYQINSNVLVPDLTIFVDISPKICAERILSRRQNGVETQIFDNDLYVKDTRYQSGIDFLQNKGWNIQRIDGSGTVEENTSACFKLIIDTMFKNNISYL